MTTTESVPAKSPCCCGAIKIQAGIFIRVNNDTIEVKNPYNKEQQFLTVFFSYKEWWSFVMRIKANGKRWFKTDKKGEYILSCVKREREVILNENQWRLFVEVVKGGKFDFCKMKAG